MCLRFKESEKEKTQRMLCLEGLVGLVPNEEDLGKNEQVVVNCLHMHLLVNPIW